MKETFKSIYRRIRKFFTKKSVGAMAALIIAAIYFSKSLRNKITDVQLSFFVLALSKNLVSEVFVQGNRVLFKSTNSDKWYSADSSMLTKDRLFTLLNEKPGVIYSSSDGSKGFNIITLAYFGVMYYAGYKLGEMLMDRFPHKKMASDEKYKSNQRFSDIYGLDRAKTELQEIIDFLKDPAKFRKVGARLRRGVLLYGPPGTGKTLLARATAGESNASFLYCSASEFVEMYVGVGAKRVRELFEQARSMSPAIIFIDEIDGIGAKRNIHHGEMTSDMERSTTLNQLLTELDGFKESENIVLIGATNRFLLLDDALLRSGRFDTKIKLDLPSIQERAGILSLHLNKKVHQVTADTMAAISKKSEGFSGADLENVVNESAYVCIRRNKEVITDEDILDAFGKVLDQQAKR